MSWKKISCTLLYKHLNKCEEYFTQHITDQLSCYEISSNTIEPQEDDVWILEAYLQNSTVDPLLLKELDIISFTEEIIDAESWMQFLNYQPEPIILNKFYIYRELLSSIEDKIPVLLNSSMAFGTGEHDSTKGCLEAMCNLTGFDKFNSILDLGTGSGILAIAAEKFFKCPTYGIDIDDDAVIVAKNHGLLNKSGAVFYNVQDFDALYGDKKFDLVIANIFANTIIELYDYIVKKQPRVIIMSGFFEDQVPNILKRYQEQYMTLNIIKLNKWTTLSLQCIED
jgi:ribosomal protein L11 methyltransferase